MVMAMFYGIPFKERAQEPCPYLLSEFLLSLRRPNSHAPKESVDGPRTEGPIFHHVTKAMPGTSPSFGSYPRPPSASLGVGLRLPALQNVNTGSTLQTAGISFGAQ